VHGLVGELDLQRAILPPDDLGQVHVPGADGLCLRDAGDAADLERHRLLFAAHAGDVVLVAERYRHVLVVVVGRRDVERQVIGVTIMRSRGPKPGRVSDDVALVVGVAGGREVALNHLEADLAVGVHRVRARRVAQELHGIGQAHRALKKMVERERLLVERGRGGHHRREVDVGQGQPGAVDVVGEHVHEYPRRVRRPLGARHVSVGVVDGQPPALHVRDDIRHPLFGLHVGRERPGEIRQAAVRLPVGFIGFNGWRAGRLVRPEVAVLLLVPAVAVGVHRVNAVQTAPKPIRVVRAPVDDDGRVAALDGRVAVVRRWRHRPFHGPDADGREKYRMSARVAHVQRRGLHPRLAVAHAPRAAEYAVIALRLPAVGDLLADEPEHLLPVEVTALPREELQPGETPGHAAAHAGVVGAVACVVGDLRSGDVRGLGRAQRPAGHGARAALNVHRANQHDLVADGDVLAGGHAGRVRHRQRGGAVVNARHVHPHIAARGGRVIRAAGGVGKQPLLLPLADRRVEQIIELLGDVVQHLGAGERDGLARQILRHVQLAGENAHAIRQPGERLVDLDGGLLHLGRCVRVEQVRPALVGVLHRERCVVKFRVERPFDGHVADQLGGVRLAVECVSDAADPLHVGVRERQDDLRDRGVRPLVFFGCQCGGQRQCHAMAVPPAPPRNCAGGCRTRPGSPGPPASLTCSAPCGW